MTPEARAILAPLITSVRAANGDLWDEIKSDIFHLGRIPPYGASHAGLAFEALMDTALKRLSADQRERLVRLWPEQRCENVVTSAADILNTYARLMVGEIMTRASEAVTRHGYYP